MKQYLRQFFVIFTSHSFSRRFTVSATIPEDGRRAVTATTLGNFGRPKTCENTTELHFELDFQMTEQDIDNLPYADAFEWEIRYVDEMNNTIHQIAFKWARDYFEDLNDNRRVSLRKLNTTEVVCIPRSRCATFTVVGLTAEQFTARLEGATIPTADYQSREFYYFGQNTSSETLTTELVTRDTGSDNHVCMPNCNADDGEELFEMSIWGNQAGYALDWVLVVADGDDDKDNKKSVLETQCPKPENARTHNCGYRDYYLYKVRRCLDQKQNYRLALSNRFGNSQQQDPPQDYPQIDITFAGEHLASFGAFKAQSLTFGRDGSNHVMCVAGHLFELFAYQGAFNDMYPGVNTIYQLSQREYSSSNSQSMLLLNGTMENSNALNYAWKCAILDACMDFTIHRDLNIPDESYTVEVILQVDGDIYSDSEVRWRKLEATADTDDHVESVEYPLIGTGCSSFDPCNVSEVLMELELDIHRELGPVTIRWDVDTYEGETYVDTLVRGDQIMDAPLLEDRTYRYFHCLPAEEYEDDRCYKLRLITYPDFNVSSVAATRSSSILLNSSMRVFVDGKVLLNQSLSLPVDGDSSYGRSLIDLVGSCSSDGLSKGKIAGAVVGSIVGFSGILLAVVWYCSRHKRNT
eukprot:scaffold1879_cov178-Amphora_coffeaeformis.AAC.2